MRYEKLQSPGHIGTVQLKNRVVMTAASCSLSEPDGRMTEEMLSYYERRAKGGVGLIITEMVCVDEQHGVLFPRELSAARDERIPDLRKLAERIHPYGTKLFAQLIHPGSNADPRLNETPLLSVSTTEGKKGAAREITIAELYDLAEKFGQAARRVKESGFDGVELHAAHHYLLHLFLSPVTNHRTDEFGGSLENRTRLLRLIVESVRRSCGTDFPLMVRVSLEEYIGKEGYHADTGIKICQMLQQWGVDAINVSASGTASKLSQSVEPINFQQGWRKHLARAVKRTVSIPVCCVALVRDPGFAEELLEQGYTDFVGSARTHLADPDWTNKALQGQESEINRCIGCMSCFEMYDREGHISCAVNPETGYEAHLPPFRKDGDGRLVLILGAGPGGMEAAYVAAQRGFRVTVYERTEKPGGQLRLAAMLPRKEKIQWCIDTLFHRCQKAGVQFVFSSAPTPKLLAKQKPYAIVDATGGCSVIPSSIEGARESPLVCTPPDVITGRVDIRGESVVVVGSGMTGLETAELLCTRERNNAVVVMEAASRIAPGVHGSSRNAVTAVLDINNVVFMLNRRLTRIGFDRIWFCDAQTGEEYIYPCDRVILALGVASVHPYGEALQEACSLVVRVGDSSQPGKLWHAVRNGYRIALGI